MKITLLSLAGFDVVFNKLRQSHSLETRSIIDDLKLRINAADSITNISYNTNVTINDADLKLLSALVRKGDSDGKFSRGLIVYVEIEAPRYWWQEFITYVVGLKELDLSFGVAPLQSESTMHTILKTNMFTSDMFEYIDNDVLDFLNVKLAQYHAQKLNKKELKYKIKSMLPEAFLQKRTYMFSYQALRRIYMQRKGHELPEWSEFLINFIEQLPLAKELIYPTKKQIDG